MICRTDLWECANLEILSRLKKRSNLQEMKGIDLFSKEIICWKILKNLIRVLHKIALSAVKVHAKTMIIDLFRHNFMNALTIKGI